MSWMTTSTGSRSSSTRPARGESARRVRRSRSENSTSSAVATAGLSSITRTVAIATTRLHGARGDGRWNHRGSQGRTEHGDLAEQPEQRRADRQELGRQPLHLVLVHEHQVHRVGHAHPEDDAERGEDEILGLEVAQDVAAGGAERTADADLAGALLDPEAGQPDDAE